MKSNLLSQGLWSGLTQFGMVAISMANTILINNFLGPEARGVLAILLLWPNLIYSLGATSIANSVTRYVSRDVDNAAYVWKKMIFPWVGVGAMLTAIGCLLVRFVLDYSADINGKLFFSMLNIFPLTVFTSCTSVLEGARRFDRIILFRLFHPFLILVGVVVLYFYQGLTPISYVSTSILSMTLISILAIKAVPRSLSHGIGIKYKKIFSYSLAVLPYTLSYVLQSRIDQLMILNYMTYNISDFGIYVASTSPSLIIVTAGFSLSSVLLPYCSTVTPSDSVQILCRMTRIFIIAISPLSLLLLLFPGEILAYVFGEIYRKGSCYLSASLVVAMLEGFFQMCNYSMHGLGRGAKSSIIGLSSCLVSFISILALKDYGFMGALTGKGIGLTWGILILMSIFKLNPLRLLPRFEDIVLIWKIASTVLFKKNVSSPP